MHRAVAEQVDELLVWDRAVRADAWDSVHQMRVVTRKIRSLLRASEESFGIADDAWVLDELRLLAGILGVARDAEVLAERYERALDELPDELVRGPVRERLVDGAKHRYQAGLRRSLDGDALRALLPVARRARGVGRRRARDAACRARKPRPSPSTRRSRRSARPSRRPGPPRQTPRCPLSTATRRCTGSASGAKQLRYTAAALGVDKVADSAKTIQSLLGDHQDSVVSRTHLSQEATAAHGAGEDTFTYGVLFEQEADLARRSEEQLDDALKQLKKAVRDAG